ncbi:urea ABC transporter substrate-binding protein [Thioalkalivibrio sp. ALE11]|uniref:urea ABC transporter substrate-binding protein n=1 Tax=Thioalkalivibrio sp. ALE11 TaxID=1265494 RepID=UPI000364EDAB|nr:urea ABC transporter substrate-binding protein [Thioalkalivibrio sp. ALE11]
MTDIKKTFSRRKLLKSMVALPIMASGIAGSKSLFAKPATSEINTTGLAVTDDTVKVGILHSLTGTMAISETGSVEAETLAIEQINEMGGILGRKLEIITEDGASDWPTFAQRARKLLREDKVASIMGCWTSASRKAVLPVLERENGLLYYPTFYEGLEQSPNVIYTGQEATQQVLASLNWLYNEKGVRSFYLVGSDYIWPRTTMKIARIHIEQHLDGASVVGEDYAPLGHTSFGSMINRIRLRRPDAIYGAVVGGSNVAFFRQLVSAGLDGSNQTLLNLATTEDEVLGIGGENVEGFYSSMKYFQSLDNENNQEFVRAFKDRWGEDSVIGDVTQAAYLGPWLWKEAVERAGSFDVDKVTAHSPGIELNQAPEGYVKVHDNHHLWSKTRIGQWRRDGQADVVWESDLIEPDPFPEGYQ